MTPNHPTINPAQLEDEDARTLYTRLDRHAHGDYVPLARDMLCEQGPPRRVTSQEENERYVPSTRLLKAVNVLTEVGLVRENVFRQTRAIAPVQVSEHYTIAHGTGPYEVTVHLTAQPHALHEGRLLALIKGAHLETRSNHTLRVAAQVPGARDVDHDPAYAAAIDISLPTQPNFYRRSIEFAGVLDEVHLYPMGTDPTLLDTYARSTLAEPEHCTYEQCVGEYSHVLAPYLPPRLELSTSFVRIRARVAPQ